MITETINFCEPIEEQEGEDTLTKDNSMLTPKKNISIINRINLNDQPDKKLNRSRSFNNYTVNVQ